MYERFTDRARKVMQLAHHEAHRFNHEYLGTEHVLLGLVKEGSGVATNVLKNLDINLDKIRQQVERIIQHGPGGMEFSTGPLPNTPRTKKVIEYAIDEARKLNHNYVGTEHLLLGMLREQEGVAAQVLMYMGLNFEDTRAEVQNLLGHTLPSTNDEAETTPHVITPSRPKPLTDEQLQAVRERIRSLAEQKELFLATQNFEDAARLREEEAALTRLLAWYVWFRTYP